jgi:hypothetical protein
MTGSFSPDEATARSIIFPLSCWALSSCGYRQRRSREVFLRSIMFGFSWRVAASGSGRSSGLFPHQLEGLRPLFHEGTGHLSLGVDMELDDARLRGTEADL